MSTWTILLDARRFIVGPRTGDPEGTKVYVTRSYHGPVAVLLSTLGVSLSVDTLWRVWSLDN